jgi:hypothetical protein
MADVREIPTPTYNYEISTLVKYYEKAMTDVRHQLERIDLLTVERAQLRLIEAEIATILSELDENAGQWVSDNIPKAVEDGVVRALVALEVASSIDQARDIVKFNRLNRDLIKTAVADTQDDLLQVTKNVKRKVRTAIRQVTAEVLRINLTKGINGTQALTSDIVKGLRKQLNDAVDSGIVAANRRRWKPREYSEMVVRTKMMRSHTEATINEAVSREVLYGVISRHNATDACRKWEGRVVKLVANAAGDYPFIGELPNREIFHPNCRHVISPIRIPERA